MRTNAHYIRKLSHHGVGFYTAEFGLTLAEFVQTLAGLFQTLAELVLILAELVQTHTRDTEFPRFGVSSPLQPPLSPSYSVSSLPLPYHSYATSSSP
jgi:hypothetical protein